MCLADRFQNVTQLNKIYFTPGIKHEIAGHGSPIGGASASYEDGRRFDSHIWQHSFVQIGHEIISKAILSLPLIQEGQLSVTGERMCTKYW